VGVTTGLSGRGMQQSPEQWALRGEALTTAMAKLVNEFKPPLAARALDVGCQAGGLVDALAERTGMSWEGIDPVIVGERTSPAGANLKHGFADELDYPNDTFDVELFANVFEHVPPDRRVASLQDMARVLRPGGVIVGQIPNPYFFVESHSRLPLMGWLPLRLQKQYWRLAPVPWEHDFFVVTLKHLRRDASSAGLRLTYSARFNYPIEVVPRAVQWTARLLAPAMRKFPWSWQFVLAKD
jgi:SAM-dependent methyltransferase